MASNRLCPVHLDSVTSWALLVPLDRAPSSLAGRDRVLCAVEVMDCRAFPEQFGQDAQIDAATRLRQTSSSINCALRRMATIPTINKALPPQHHQLHQRFVPDMCHPTATTFDLTGGPPSRRTSIACRTALKMALYRHPPDCQLRRDDKPAACATFSAAVAARAAWPAALKRALYRHPPDCQLRRDDKPAAGATFSAAVAARAAWPAALKMTAENAESAEKEPITSASSAASAVESYFRPT